MSKQKQYLYLKVNINDYTGVNITSSEKLFDEQMRAEFEARACVSRWSSRSGPYRNGTNQHLREGRTARAAKALGGGATAALGASDTRST